MKRRMRRGGDQNENKDDSNFGGFGPSGSVKDLPKMVAGIRSNDPKIRFQCSQRIRKILSVEKNPPIQQVLDTGVHKNLVDFLRGDFDTKLQFEACWALTNIASGTTYHTRAIVEVGALEAFVGLLRCRDPEVREQAVWAIGNVAGDSTGYRDLVLKSDALQSIMAMCNPKSAAQTLRNCAWTLSNLCRGKPQPHCQAVMPMIPTLKNLISHNDAEVLTDTCWALSYVSDDNSADNQKITAVLRSGAVPYLINFLQHPNNSITTPALRTIGNIVTGDDRQTQVVIECNALPALRTLLSHQKKSIRKETCWTISNITAGNQTQIQAVIDAELIPQLVNVLEKAEFDLKKEAAWAIANAISGGSSQQLEFLVSHGIIEPFAKLFSCHESKIVMLVMDAMERILEFGQKHNQMTGGENRCAEMLEECGGLDLIEDLQRHENEEIYDKAVNILKNYFESEEGDEEEDASLKPSLNNNASQFSFGTMGAAAPSTGFTF